MELTEVFGGWNLKFTHSCGHPETRFYSFRSKAEADLKHQQSIPCLECRIKSESTCLTNMKEKHKKDSV